MVAGVSARCSAFSVPGPLASETGSFKTSALTREIMGCAEWGSRGTGGGSCFVLTTLVGSPFLMGFRILECGIHQPGSSTHVPTAAGRRATSLLCPGPRGAASAPVRLPVITGRRCAPGAGPGRVTADLGNATRGASSFPVLSGGRQRHTQKMDRSRGACARETRKQTCGRAPTAPHAWSHTFGSALWFLTEA